MDGEREGPSAGREQGGEGGECVGGASAIGRGAYMGKRE